MKKCAFLSTSDLEGFFVYDRLVEPHLNKLGWTVEEVSWREDSVDWNQYDVVIVRSTWDYQVDVDNFVNCLAEINASSAILENSFETMKWNISKTYLRQLAQEGIPIIPTLWCDQLSENDLKKCFENLGATEVVIKPYISANADFTYRLTKKDAKLHARRIVLEYEGKGAMIQPFVSSVVEEGEYSLFYFDANFSHCILKTPKDNDFRVQEEHGGTLRLTKPIREQLELGQKTLNALPDTPLYARIDIVDAGGYMSIIEVELIEPSLYFNMDKASAKRFAEAIVYKHGN